MCVQRRDATKSSSLPPKKTTYFVANRISLSLFLYMLFNKFALKGSLAARLLSNEERCHVHIYIHICFHNTQPAENKVNGIHVFVLCVCVCVCFVGCLLHVKQMPKISSSIE